MTFTVSNESSHIWNSCVVSTVWSVVNIRSAFLETDFHLFGAAATPKCEILVFIWQLCVGQIHLLGAIKLSNGVFYGLNLLRSSAIWKVQGDSNLSQWRHGDIFYHVRNKGLCISAAYDSPSPCMHIAYPYPYQTCQTHLTYQPTLITSLNPRTMQTMQTIQTIQTMQTIKIKTMR